MRRLSQAGLRQIEAQVKLPAYNREDLSVGIVHLGLGAFCRAHLATYTDQILAKLFTDGMSADWAVLGVSLQSASVQKQLKPQDGLFTVVEQSPTNIDYSVIGAVKDVFVAPDNPQAVIAAMQMPTVKVVSLTVTEKGYCCDPASGELLTSHPDIQWDLANPEHPRTAIGFLVAGLAARFAAERKPFTPLSCDNLPNNGRMLRHLVLSLARLQEPGLAQRIEAEVSFPSTMVDRIVPPTSPEVSARLTDELGYIDLGLVQTEPFCQWVIEDQFVDGRPPWDIAGALFVDDVSVYESMKLRLLNGSHSAIAYLGSLAGYDYIHEAVNDQDIARFIRALMDGEMTRTLTAPPGIDLADYKQDLMARFSNSALPYRCRQVAMDSTQKLPQRLLAPLRDLLAKSLPYDGIALVLAGWMCHVCVSEVRDPLALELTEIARRQSSNPAGLVGDLLAVETVFGQDLAANAMLRARLVYWVVEIQTHGVRQVLRDL